MSQQFVIHIFQSAIYTVLMLTAPVLGLALIVGLMIGIFQAVTSINEMTLTFIPKIVVVVLALVFFSPWIMKVMLIFTIDLIQQIPNFAK